MSVVLSNQEVGPCRRELKIEVPAPAVEAETERVIAELRSKAQLPGFRRGKVPARVIRQRFKDEIDKEVLERLLPRYWRQAQAETSLEPLLAPEVKEVEHEPGTPLTFSATVEVRPDIELGEYRDLELPEMEVEPADDELTSALDELRRRHGTWNEVDRTAARGDRATAQLARLDDEGEPGDEQPAAFEVGDAQVWEELTLAVTGLAAGGEETFTRRGEDEQEERFRVRLEKVEELELPPLDDEFTQRHFDRDLAELEKQVREEIRRNKEHERSRQREQALLAQLCERYPLVLPEGVVEEETRRLLGDYAEELARRGVDVEQAEIDWSGLAAQVKPQAERRVHSRLLLDAIAEEELVVVPEDELERTIAALARAQGRSPALVRGELDEAGKLSALRAQLRRARIVRELLGEQADE